MPLDQEVPLHPLVSLASPHSRAKIVASPGVVRQIAFSAPPPPSVATTTRFRQGLSLEEIHNRLEYFTREVFGYPRGTKPLQDRVLKRIFDGKNVLGISATGSGKSFCFWLPAFLRPGLTLVVCPLRSLMRDQRLNLSAYGIASAEFINTDVPPVEQRRILTEARRGEVRLLYLSPERLRMKKFLAELAQLQEVVPINLLAVDEAHCISEWGHDFRPSYLKLPFLREMLTRRNADLQLAALTATAGPLVEQDMRGILKLSEEDVVREKKADREHFSYQIVQVPAGASKTKIFHDILVHHLPKALKRPSLSQVLSHVNARNEKAIGIVFCIYADPHGQHSTKDGVAHFTYETKRLLEPDRVLTKPDGVLRFRRDAFSTGRVRAFASKEPSLCPKCGSYDYISLAKAPSRQGQLAQRTADDGASEPGGSSVGVKVCLDCGHKFQGRDAASPDNWDEVLRTNQEDFKAGAFDVLVATKGFGMGIDKSSVRFIVHTSFSAGLESWYQEVGRAGRDEERAHIVLLVDPPIESCYRELAASEIQRPRCSYSGGCPHGKETLCDYGKQHLFISESYPGPESDAFSALRIFDKIIGIIHTSPGAPIVLSAGTWVAYYELALHRLKLLGLVQDYIVRYTKRSNAEFEVTFSFPHTADDPDALGTLGRGLGARLRDYFAHFPTERARHLCALLDSWPPSFTPTDEFREKIEKLELYWQYPRLYRIVYSHLLLLLEHTYTDVVRMRYNMLWNLLGVVREKRCRRLNILSAFQEEWPEDHRCECCDNCRPNLDFADRRRPPPRSQSHHELELELEELIKANRLDLERLSALAEAFAEYPTATYRRARAILEGDPNNLPALFLSREFSPPQELVGNAKRLLGAANRHLSSFEPVRLLFNSSPRQAAAELLVLLNEAGTAADSPEGWKFLIAKGRQAGCRRNPRVKEQTDWLEFFVWVDEDLPEVLRSIANKAQTLKCIDLCQK